MAYPYRHKYILLNNFKKGINVLFGWFCCFKTVSSSLGWSPTSEDDLKLIASPSQVLDYRHLVVTGFLLGVLLLLWLVGWFWYKCILEELKEKNKFS